MKIAGSTLKGVPVVETTTTITQTHETDSNQERTPVEANTSQFVDSQLLTTLSKNFQDSLFQSDDKKNDTIVEKDEEFQPCRVSNETYQHREKIPRMDPCEMCVCVDSEMYCFWKLCTFFKTAVTTPLATSSSDSLNNRNTATTQSINDNKIILDNFNEEAEKFKDNDVTNEKYSKLLTDQRKYNVLKKLEATSPEQVTTTEQPSTSKFTSSTAEPTVCYVMGVMYKYGEVLPKDTGTCLECSCSEGGRVTCSPKDCVSQPDLDYLSHNNNLDMFDIDTF